MRLRVTLNGKQHFVAALPGAGFLSAHINLSDRPKEKTIKRMLRVEGFGTNSDSETKSVKWAPLELSVGDIVQLELLEEGLGDPPAEEKTTKEAESNLFSNEQLAKELLDLEKNFEKQLFEFLEKVEKLEPPEEYNKFKRALGHVVVELGDHFLYPIWRRHEALIPEEMKGELL